MSEDNTVTRAHDIAKYARLCRDELEGLSCRLASVGLDRAAEDARRASVRCDTIAGDIIDLVNRMVREEMAEAAASQKALAEAFLSGIGKEGKS